MLQHSALLSARRKLCSVSLVLATLLFATASLRAQSERAPAKNETTPAPANKHTSPASGNTQATPTLLDSVLKPPTQHGHQADTSPGQTPHQSNRGPAIAESIAATAAMVVTVVLIEKMFQNHSPNKLGHDGPQVPKKAFDMNEFSVTGLASPGWPVVLDFMLDAPGEVQIEVVGADNGHYKTTMPNTPNHRNHAIVHLPSNFGTKLQTAVYQIRAIPPIGKDTPAPRLRTYGLGAGEKAVGSVAIDQLTFQPAMIHPKAKEVATYGFHAHSDFDSARAEFIFTTLHNGHVLAERGKGKGQALPPIPEGERGGGIWTGEGQSGEHLLQIRAWRGLQKGGDWVVAWSPDIVDVVK